jgi:uncharacterized protein with PhoU and TrkA domain
MSALCLLSVAVLIALLVHVMSLAVAVSLMRDSSASRSANDIHKTILAGGTPHEYCKKWLVAQGNRNATK